MSKLTISGVYGADGEYDFDFEARPFTNGELHTIKTVANVRAGELQEAIEQNDNDLLVALALIVLGRHGKQIPVASMWLAEVGALTFDFAGDDEEEAAAEAIPPPSEPGLPATGPETSEPFGQSSNGTQDDPPVSTPPSTGALH